ncbi:hypothetical protein K469DRAFT_748794 [Zopfia rhizophila CBS 207.26]|uniref:Zinc finger PHD-type domain-containing protein n=1 Tax=Zopfia rhizophila CBS 207.26 TaxID=1314779 RepID=A0A6A6EBT3_9PEZI|nr:hypothetical protein K469DRAFT_748794 [Zopfia rhizophila CBS 207.26]
MYRFGAWTRTLPNLDGLYPGMLEQVALAGRVLESKTRSDNTRPARVNDLRRREKDEYDDPIECRCGFSHFASACVHCKNCLTWQHIWCYYDSDSLSAAPAAHTCDKCTAHNVDTKSATNEDHASLHDYELNDSNEKLLDALLRLQIHSYKNDNLVVPKSIRRIEQKPGANQTRQIITCPILNEEDFFYGLRDQDVQSVVKIVTTIVNTVAYSINKDDFELQIPSTSAIKGHPDLFEALQNSGFCYSSDQMELTSTEKFSFLKMVMGSAVWNWTFCAQSPFVPKDGFKNRSEALLNACRDNSHSHHDLKVLRNALRTAWTTVTIDRPDTIKSIIEKEADYLACRLLCMLSSVIARRDRPGDSRPLKTADDWIHSTKNGRSRFKLIVELFTHCIKLKGKLPLSDYYYELHYPTSSEGRFIAARPEDYNREIHFCFAPAILEYEPKMFQRTEYSASAVFGEQIIIRTTDAQRKESRVVCPAVVTFR